MTSKKYEGLLGWWVEFYSQGLRMGRVEAIIKQRKNDKNLMVVVRTPVGERHRVLFSQVKRAYSRDTRQYYDIDWDKGEVLAPDTIAPDLQEETMVGYTSSVEEVEKDDGTKAYAINIPEIPTRTGKDRMIAIVDEADEPDEEELEAPPSSSFSMNLVYGVSRWTNPHKASARHIDDGTGEPLCRSGRKCTWMKEVGEPTCRTCIRMQEKGIEVAESDKEAPGSIQSTSESDKATESDSVALHNKTGGTNAVQNSDRADDMPCGQTDLDHWEKKKRGDQNTSYDSEE